MQRCRPCVVFSLALGLPALACIAGDLVGQWSISSAVSKRFRWRSQISTQWVLSEHDAKTAAGRNTKESYARLQESSTTQPQAVTVTPLSGVSRQPATWEKHECGLQAKEFSFRVVTTFEQCEAATVGEPKCGKYFQWNDLHPGWSCRCCVPFHEKGGPTHPTWHVYMVREQLARMRVWPTTTLPPEPRQELPPPLYARSRRCKRVVHTFLGAEGATVRACLKSLSSQMACGRLAMFSGANPHWGCHCCDASGPDWEDLDNHHWDVYIAPTNFSETLERPRLHMLAITHGGGVPSAGRIEHSLRRRMSPIDRLSYVCDSACARVAEGKLKDVIEMPDFEMDSLAVNPECLKHNGRPRVLCGHRLGAMKFIFGLVKEVRRMLATGYPMPLWWMVQDDDTYVHVENLMAAVNGTAEGLPLSQTKVSFGRLSPGCPGICGGQGWLLSGVAAEALVKHHGKKLMESMEDWVIHGSGYYDVYVPEIVRWANIKLHDLTAMNDCGLNKEKIVPKLPVGGQKNGPLCWEKPYCPCSRSPAPGTWHIKGGGELQLFDADP